MPDPRQRAFLEMLEPVYDRLSRYALAITRDVMDAEDLVSETVLQAFQRFDAARDPDKFIHYLITIASRLHKRRRFRERKRVTYDEVQALNLPDSTASPEQAAEIRIVMDAMNILPEKMRETVVLFEVSDFSLEEIRHIQGGTLSGVKSRLKRGREHVARALGVRSPEVKSKVIEKNRATDRAFLLHAEERYV
jgi:RNA polymerase sigma-70 factor, ECF subfamily